MKILKTPLHKIMSSTTGSIPVEALVPALQSNYEGMEATLQKAKSNPRVPTVKELPKAVLEHTNATIAWYLTEIIYQMDYYVKHNETGDVGVIYDISYSSSNAKGPGPVAQLSFERDNNEIVNLNLHYRVGFPNGKATTWSFESVSPASHPEFIGQYA